MRDFCRFMWLMATTYRQVVEKGSMYVALKYRGVPQFCCLLANGREAWRVTQIAIESKLYEL